MTKAEKLLWSKLRNNRIGTKFRRQQPIGKCIVDFVAFEKKLIIEINGGQHLESRSDRERDFSLKNEGFRVLRFWNNEVLANIEGVVEVIAKELSPSL